MNESEKRQVEEDFWKVMRDSIWYCARNVTGCGCGLDVRATTSSLCKKNQGSHCYHRRRGALLYASVQIVMPD